MTNIALFSIAFVLISFFVLSAAITLYAVLRLSRKMIRNYGEMLEVEVAEGAWALFGI